MNKDFYVYMLASQKNGTIYKGMTSDLKKRIWEHRNNITKGFTEKYDVKNLVWYKHCETAENAITWEKKLRRYPRKWKLNLIEELNPNWNDLYEEICK
jgi:putative endonuclease